MDTVFQEVLPGFLDVFRRKGGVILEVLNLLCIGKCILKAQGNSFLDSLFHRICLDSRSIIGFVLQELRGILDEVFILEVVLDGRMCLLVPLKLLANHIVWDDLVDEIVAFF